MKVNIVFLMKAKIHALTACQKLKLFDYFNCCIEVKIEMI